MDMRRRRNGYTDLQIVESYRQTKSSNITAKNLGISSKIVYRVLCEQGEPRVGIDHWRKNARRFVGQEQEIKEAYENGMTYRELQQRFDPNSEKDSALSLKQAIKRVGGTLREIAPRVISDEELDQIRTMYANGMSQFEISVKLGRTQTHVSRAMRQHGIATHYWSGDEHPMWKGGRCVDSNGYVRVLVERDDPMISMALNSGHILEHRLNLARKLGRPLLSTETVHHIDGDHTNNDPDNLQLRHGKHGKHIVLCCADCGSRNVKPIELD